MTGTSGSDPVVSVVMPVFTGAQYLRDSLGSLAGQSFERFEVIVVDDGSGADVEGVTSSFRSLDVRVIRTAHVGEPAAANTGIRSARGAYVARQDVDDLSAETRLARQVAFLEQHPECAGVGSFCTILNESGIEKDRERLVPTELHPCLPDAIGRRLPEGNCIIHTSAMLRAGCVERVGGYREELRYCSDYDLWLRIFDHGMRMANICERLCRVREHGESMTGAYPEVVPVYTEIVKDLHRDRVKTGSDVIERGGRSGFWEAYGSQIDSLVRAMPALSDVLFESG